MPIASRHLTSGSSSVGAACFGLLRERNPLTAKQSREEYLSFLRKFEVPHDERYIFAAVGSE